VHEVLTCARNEDINVQEHLSNAQEIMLKKDINLVGLCSLTLSSNLVNMHLLVFDHFQLVSTLMSKEW